MRGAGENENPKCEKAGGNGKGETTLQRAGRLRSCSLEALALPALLAPPRLFTLAGRCVSLLCWLRGWAGARGPEWSLGEQDAERRGPGWEVGGAVSGERKLYS